MSVRTRMHIHAVQRWTAEGMDGPRNNHVDVRISRWSMEYSSDALTWSTLRSIEYAVNILAPWNSLLFVGFLDQRGYWGADDYRGIQIFWLNREAESDIGLRLHGLLPLAMEGDRITTHITTSTRTIYNTRTDTSIQTPHSRYYSNNPRRGKTRTIPYQKQPSFASCTEIRVVKYL